MQTPRALDDVQFAKLLAALPKLNGRTTDADRAKLKSLAIMMRMTGLALKDAVCCERKVFEPMPNGVFRMYLRRAKTGNQSTITSARKRWPPARCCEPQRKIPVHRLAAN